MPEISAEAQVLLDRLSRMDPANPRHDTAAIEQALSAHLEALSLPQRPFVWAEDAQAGYQLARRTVWDPAIKKAWDSVGAEPWDPDAWDDIALEVMPSGRGCCGVENVTWWTARNADPDMGKYEDARNARKNAALFAAFAFAEIYGLNASQYAKPDTIKRASIWLPLLDAFEAGLFLWWKTPDEMICVLQPSLSIVAGRLDRADGPAVWWESGERYYFRRGVRIHDWMIENPGRISIASIRSEPNQEVRRCMTEIYGRDRYLRESGAHLVHQDAFGRLWEAEGAAGECWRFIEVENGTPESDGSRRTYILDVTGAAERLGWPIKTARAAVAATYGLCEEEYSPEVRT